ncbi:hypothetical protein [Priestia aryabhattai]|uniref:hypothetical protein n=1 Tax=Priestia aryabhattai TaxID=412384 RepID=UPI0015941E5E
MVDLDFSKIRIYDGSKDNGFEELVCQLAHLSRPENADYFVRKEGAGGDGGVECYWKLLDGTEHGWQAKYFPERLEESQWRQISDSVATALDKHPDLKKYYVCLPRDWTDSRKTVRGKTVQSAWDKWEEHVKEWESLAKKKGMEVEFLYWCKHEISLMLQTDSPYYAGRALYWFNEPIVNIELLNRIAIKSREALGERFTPENHLELSISRHFDGLGLSPEWNERLKEQRNLVIQLLKELNTDFFGEIEALKHESCWVSLYEELTSVLNEYSNAIRGEYETVFYDYRKLKDIYNIKEDLLKSCSYSILKQIDEEMDEKLGNIHGKLSAKFTYFREKVYKVGEFLQSKVVQAMASKAVVLLGEAGIGKSHLLCDISLKRLEKSLPTLFLLGQRYSGGNPLKFILDELDIFGVSYQQVLGALDAAGEARRTRSLIVIDAINEGQHREEWIDYISALISEISNFPNISLVLSCRSTYEDYTIPEIHEERLTRFYHRGFKGYEHRAAMKYLSNQGISKPSTPITSPEFSNPLFLKTCCKALKANGHTSFPKGLQGQSKLFAFYLDSVEKTINRKKRYLVGQNVIHNAINEFIKLLYPDNLFGIPVAEAVNKINAYDTNPYLGDNLVTLLIDEGLLSFDVIPDQDNTRGKEVVRFTYERFSDHFIAQYIINKIEPGNIESDFLEEGSIRKLINRGHSSSGIIEALGVGFPEKLNCEFIDFIQEDSYEYDWLFSSSFTDVILWRAKDSFNERTLELLNQVPRYGFQNKAIDILLSLATEPEHPWNAYFLEGNLRGMTLAERDAFWSTHVAISDWEESEDQSESVLRSIIDWSLSANIRELEPERLQLTAMTLLWLTTTTNRKVRDQATKSLARILAHIPGFLPSFIVRYNDIDDLYLVERLYAASYGAIVNIDDRESITKTAECVFNQVFKDGNPYPHILLRDYARGILEYGYAKGDLPNHILPELFRPPYNSNWPIENLSMEEINKLAKLVGDESYSSIKNSLLGFIGDFGRYTMSCLRNWSPTPLNEAKPESCLEIHQKFAETLPSALKERYITYINKFIESQSVEINIEEFWKETSFKVEEEAEEQKNQLDEWDCLKADIEEILNGEDKERFRWVCSLGFSIRLATFNEKWAQKWVCKRAYELGWNSTLFQDFEKICTSNQERTVSRVERIGKKYQWIALHELLARMSDNLHWIDPGYIDVDYSQFWGPWQINKRDLDPTLWKRKTGDSGWNLKQKVTWWQPYEFPFVEGELDQQKEWVWDRTIIPPFRDMLIRKNPSDNQDWIVIKGFSSFSKNNDENQTNEPTQDGWFRINSCIVHKKDIKKFQKSIQGQNLCDPDILSPNSTGNQAFYKEYPWHPSCKEMMGWRDPGLMDDYHEELVNVTHLVPVNEYNWEAGGTDKSIEETISMYLPTQQLINELKIQLFKNGIWTNSKRKPVFIDPSAFEPGPSYALIDLRIFEQWLTKNDLHLVWLIGGEKQLLTTVASEYYGRLVYSGLFTLDNGSVKGDLWFIEEK